MFPARDTNHVVAATLFLDSHLAERAWLGRPPDLVHVLLRCLIVVAHLIKLVTRHAFVPSALVVLAYLGLTLGTCNVGDVCQVV